PTSVTTSSASSIPISIRPPPRWKGAMRTRPRPPKSRTSKTRQAFACMARALLVHGCATPPRAPEAEPGVKAEDSRVLARDNDYAIVIARADDSAESLAQRYL